MTREQTIRNKTREEQMDFEARRMHNLIGLYEGARNLRERLRAADSVARALGRYLAEFHHLGDSR